MTDLTYIALIVCLLASNVGRLWRLLSWIQSLLRRPLEPQLIPYFDEQGNLIGLVRVPVEFNERNARLPAYTHPRDQALDTNISVAWRSGAEYSDHETKSLPPVASDSTEGKLDSTGWNCWPDGNFERMFDWDEMFKTHGLATNWLQERLRKTSGAFPSPKDSAAISRGVRYTVASHVYSSSTASHFIVRYCSFQGGKTRIFDYDDRKHEGHAILHPATTLNGVLTGPSDRLKDLPQGYQLQKIVYHLDGGEEAQKYFRQEQITRARGLGLHFGVNPDSKTGIPSSREFRLRHIQSVTGLERFWLSPTATALDYTIVPPEKSARRTASPQKKLVVPTKVLPIPAQARRLSTSSSASSQSTSSGTPSPINCHGCGEVSDGDSDPDQVQCSRCKFWSHFRCQSEDVDWSNSDVIFTCQGCKPKTPDQLFFPREIVMLPDPQVEEWQDEGVLWYPARFVRDHQKARDPPKQFDFRFFEGIQWPGAQDDGFAPPSLVHRDKTFCEDILKILLKPNQIGKIRIAANSTSDPPDSHPLMKIFDAAVTPLAKLLLSWPGDHPVINTFNLYTAAHSETRIKPSSWLPEFFRHPEAELAPLFRPPYAKLWDSVDLVSLPDEERSRRIANVARPILQLLAIQHELEEPFNLNGDLFEDIVEDEILRCRLEHEECLRAMFFATKPRQLTHKRHWDKKAFGETLRDFWNSHSIFDPTFRPITYLRLVPRESRRPAIGIDTRTESPMEAQLTGTIRTRDNEDGDNENPGRPLKRRTMLPVHGRQLQSRDKKPCKERKMSPKGKVVAKGPGWVTLEMDESG
ncbi:hypothetical protein K438DRAFT_1781660 [Mycena galopus ATCC 62051]|nr:hypothetical protein K438DRAFT_1781660 [Mycena galopus ATCC 62051]